MKLFPRDTRDAIEQLYANEVLKTFPKYGEFWQKLVGVRDNYHYLNAYELKIPRQVSGSEAKRIRRAHEEIGMTHYTIFCNLASAHYHTKILSNLSSPASTKESFFGHWDSFECVYLRLQIALFEVFHLWDLLFFLRKQLQRTKDGFGPVPGGRSKGELRREVFKSARMFTNWKEFERLYDEVSVRRNNTTHYSRGASRIDNGEIYVPLRVRRNVPWSSELRSKKYRDTRQLVCRDLERVEIAINSFHALLIRKLEEYLTNSNIALAR